MSIEMDCSICCSPSNTLIECPFCDYTACAKCCQRYLVENINTACCMNCKKVFDREFLIKSLGSKWYNSVYKQTREDVMFNNQRALFNETLPFIPIYKELVLLGKNKSSNYSYKRMVFYASLHYGYEYYLNYGTPRNVPAQTQTVSGSTLQCFPCPYTTCKQGVVNTKTGLCTACSQESCCKCHECKESGHICNTVILANIKTIKANSKQCPECYAYIQRSFGCSQMWCTQCRTFLTIIPDKNIVG